MNNFAHTQILDCIVCGNQLKYSNCQILRNVPSIAQHFAESPERSVKLKTDLMILHCGNCSHTQIQNQPVYYYKDCIRSSHVSPTLKQIRKLQFRKFVDNYQMFDKSIIEIGSGTGEYCRLLKKYCRNVFALENCENGISIDGVNFIKGYPTDSSILKRFQGRFQGLVCFNFLEHSPDPRTFLCSCHRLLDNNGAAIIEVPNSNLIFENKYLNEITIEHLQYFTKKSFILLLERCGFEVVKITHRLNNYILSAEVKKYSSGFDFKLRQYVDNLTKKFKICLERHSIHNISVWGAGHQAITTICLLKNPKVFQYIYDSSPCKIGRYAPGTDKLVRNPKQIPNDDISSILVMAGGYNKEVIRVLKKSFPCVKNIIELCDNQFKLHKP